MVRIQGTVHHERTRNVSHSHPRNMVMLLSRNLPDPLCIPIYQGFDYGAWDGVWSTTRLNLIRIQFHEHGNPEQRRSRSVEPRRNVRPLPLRHLRHRRHCLLYAPLDHHLRHPRTPRPLHRRLHPHLPQPPTTTRRLTPPSKKMVLNLLIKA